MAKLILFNKPYGVLSQFSHSEHGESLATYISIDKVYPAGRLDKDSEGLLLLTDNGSLQHQIAHPHKKMEKCYWVQIEGVPEQAALQQLRQGVSLKDGITLPAKAKIMDPPQIWPREPPIRARENIPTCWLELKISEGRNRQVRRMTAAIGHPTLRLIRFGIGNWTLETLKPGEYRELEIHMPTPKSRNRPTSRNKKPRPKKQ